MQKYTEIDENKTLGESRELLLNNDKTAISCNAGTAFPVTNLQAGMLCFRTDIKKLYQLSTDGKTWIELFDLSSNASLVNRATTADNALKANTAGTASSVPWSGVTGKPSSYTPSTHTHDDIYYTESEINSKVNTINSSIDTKADKTHTHDDRYYTESEIDSKLAGKQGSLTATGSATKGIYIDSSGTAKAMTYSVNKDVPSDAKFTDTVYTHPTTAGNKHIPSGGSSGQILRWSADGTAVWGADNNTTYSAATQSANGLMSAADKAKLDGIATGANAYTHPNSGVTAGTYRSVTVNAQGHVTAGSNPTTLSGYGITDAPTKTGGGASGTWGINISGNAASATTANTATLISGFANIDSGTWGHSTGTYITGFQEKGGGSIQWRAEGGRLYERVDGTFWQREGTYEVIDTSTVNNYAPTKTGGGASGTWGINISGNATKDSAGQQINTTYIKGLSISGKTITYTKGDGTTGTITIQDTAYTHPVGTVQMFAGKTIPAGWLLCNGAAISRTTYSALYNVIGTTYGAGDGSTTFALPNLIDKFVQGAATAGTYKEAGLPNIKGSITPSSSYQSSNIYVQFLSEVNASTSGALYCKNTHAVHGVYDDPQIVNGVPYSIDFDASRSNGAYGNSTTVQPPALTMLPIIKY